MLFLGSHWFNIADLNDVWIMANLEENSIGKARHEQMTDFTVDTYPGRIFHGEVIMVGAATGSEFTLMSSDDSYSGNFKKVIQRLSVKDPTLLKSGLAVIVSIHIKTN